MAEYHGGEDVMEQSYSPHGGHTEKQKEEGARVPIHSKGTPLATLLPFSGPTPLNFHYSGVALSTGT